MKRPDWYPSPWDGFILRMVAIAGAIGWAILIWQVFFHKGGK